MSQIHKQTIYKAISEPLFAKDVFSRLPIEDFKEDGYDMIVSTLNLYYRTHDAPLEEQTLLTLVEDKMLKQNKSLEAQQAAFNLVSDLYKLEEAETDSEAISESVQNYVRKTLTREAIMEAVTNDGALGSDQNIQSLMESLRGIMTIDTGGHGAELLDFFADIDKKKEHLRNLQQNKYPTGFMAIDAISDGGLARGEVGMVIAPTGGGKTTWAVNQARNYVVRGLNVLYIPLEEKIDRMIVRFEQLLSQQSKNSILVDGELNEQLYDQIQQAYGAGKEQLNWGNLWIRKYKPQELTPSGLSQLISDVMIRKGQQIDVVIIDYPDLMKNPHSSGGNGESDAGGKLYEDIRSIAQEYDFVCWTLSQLNRASYGQEVKNAGAIEGSKRKMNAVELIFTLNQTPEEFQSGFIRAYVDKLRNNSGVAYDKMLYFKVIPETMTIRDETQEERMAHANLLEQTMEVARDNYKKENNFTPKDAQSKINNLNAQLAGGLK